MNETLNSVRRSPPNLFLIHTLCTLTFLFSTPAQSCLRLFQTPFSFYETEVKARATEILAHQNGLRAEAGLRQFGPADIKKNLRKKPPSQITPDRRYIIVDSKLVLVGYETEFVFPAMKVDDVHSLNHVYQFNGKTLIEAIPATRYFISRMPELIELRRDMSPDEARLWKSGDLDSLRSHSRAIGWGYHVPVVHLSLRSFHRGINIATVRFSVPRNVLLEWAEHKWVTIGTEGYENGKPSAIEIVVKTNAWDALIQMVQ